MHFHEWKLLHFDEDFTEICSPRSNQQYSIIGSDNGLAPIRRQSIIFHYLNQRWLTLMTHICTTRPQWPNYRYISTELKNQISDSSNDWLIDVSLSLSLAVSVCLIVCLVIYILVCVCVSLSLFSSVCVCVWLRVSSRFSLTLCMCLSLPLLFHFSFPLFQSHGRVFPFNVDMAMRYVIANHQIERDKYSSHKTKPLSLVPRPPNTLWVHWVNSCLFVISWQDKIR